MIRNEYMLVSGDSVDDLEKRVNTYLEQGWKLYCGPTMVYNPIQNGLVCVQAVIREYEQPGAWG